MDGIADVGRVAVICQDSRLVDRCGWPVLVVDRRWVP
jgi:hypothetical protein